MPRYNATRKLYADVAMDGDGACFDDHFCLLFGLGVRDLEKRVELSATAWRVLMAGIASVTRDGVWRMSSLSNIARRIRGRPTSVHTAFAQLEALQVFVLLRRDGYQRDYLFNPKYACRGSASDRLRQRARWREVSARVPRPQRPSTLKLYQEWTMEQRLREVQL